LNATSTLITEAVPFNSLIGLHLYFLGKDINFKPVNVKENTEQKLTELDISEPEIPHTFEFKTLENTAQDLLLTDRMEYQTT